MALLGTNKYIPEMSDVHGKVFLVWIAHADGLLKHALTPLVRKVEPSANQRWAGQVTVFSQIGQMFHSTL